MITIRKEDSVVKPQLVGQNTKKKHRVAEQSLQRGSHSKG